jgi:signal transduction histidine kinase/DNA-binding CsgD family transcriptional regulator
MAHDDREPGRETLTVRQREIAALVARGYTNQQIATEMVITPGTAANHVQQILGRVGLGSRAELAAWASQRGITVSRNRLLMTLERLLAISPSDLDSALDAASLAVAEALRADKVDTFLYDPSTSTLVARGTSPTPLGRKQHALGLHRLAVANGGRMVEVFETGNPRLAGHVERDKRELRGIRIGLGIRSEISVPLVVDGERRGVLSAVSTAAEFFTEGDLSFLTTVAHWVAVVAHRAELAAGAVAEAAAAGRRAAAEELVTVLAHDFRNLLAPLRGRLELMARRSKREASDREQRDVEELIGTVDRLARLVRDLLDTARLNQQLFELNREPLDLVDLLRAVAAHAAPWPDAVVVQAPAHEIVVSADPSRMRQVFENLLTNAFKVQPSNVPVIVDVTASDGCAVVSVIDQGPGIPADVLPRLFERFTRDSSSTGLGLGLYLARGITEAHGGSLEVVSLPGQGTRFVVRVALEGRSLASEMNGQLVSASSNGARR